MPTPEHMRTWHGYAVDEVASAVQKCIRRGYEEQAIYWSFEMMESPNKSHYTNLWNRLKVIASEDVGMGQPFMTILIDVLHRNWKEKHDHVFTINAVIALVRAPKSRIVDNAINMIKSEWKLNQVKQLTIDSLDETKLEPAVPPPFDNRNVPGYAIDKHTRAGKKHGLGKADFYEEGAKLNDKAPIRDPYEARAIAGDLEVERRERMQT